MQKQIILNLPPHCFHTEEEDEQAVVAGLVSRARVAEVEKVEGREGRAAAREV